MKTELGIVLSAIETLCHAKIMKMRAIAESELPDPAFRKAYVAGYEHALRELIGEIGNMQGEKKKAVKR